MSAQVLRLVPKQERVNRNVTQNVAYTALEHLFYLVDQAQLNVNECWDRVLATATNGESDQMAVLDYEMALNDLIEAKTKAGL